MTINAQIEYWRKAADVATTKSAALVAFGVMAGLRLSREYDRPFFECPTCGKDIADSAEPHATDCSGE